MKTNKPMFSIIIPTLNEENFLPKLLESLTVQTDKNFEVIVVDGSSRDKTVQRARTFAKKISRLDVLISPKASLPLQRNFGAKKAKGDWFIFIDADNVLMPNFMERIELFIRTKAPSVFTTWAVPDSDENNDSILTLLMNLYVEAILNLKRPLTPGPLTCIRRDYFELIEGYDESHAFHEDVDFGLRLAKHGIPISILREGLFIWSQRRYRREGRMKVFRQYALSFLPILFKRPMKYMPGYVMGGHLYKSKTPSVLKQYESKLKALLKEILE